jgi:hypothetical protein
LEVPVPQETISQEKQNTTPSKSWEKKIVQNDEEIPDWLK